MEHPNPLASYTSMDDTSTSHSTQNTVASSIRSEIHEYVKSNTGNVDAFVDSMFDGFDGVEEDYRSDMIFRHTQRIDTLCRLNHENDELKKQTMAAMVINLNLQNHTQALTGRVNQLEDTLANKDKQIEELNRKLNDDDSFTISHEGIDNETLRSHKSELIGDKKLLEEENRILLALFQEKEEEVKSLTEKIYEYLSMIVKLNKKVTVLSSNQRTAVTLVDEVENDLPRYGAGDDNQNSSVIDDFCDTSSTSDEGDVSEESENVFNEVENDLPKYGAGDDNQNSSGIDDFCDTSSTSDEGDVSEESENVFNEVENDLPKYGAGDDNQNSSGIDDFCDTSSTSDEGDVSEESESENVFTEGESIKPKKNDILCVQGIKNPPGNREYRKTVNSYKNEYFFAPRGQKGEVAMRLYSEVKNWKPEGRFLKKNPENKNQWIELSKREAIDKIMSALRDGASGIETIRNQPAPEIQNAPPAFETAAGVADGATAATFSTTAGGGEGGGIETEAAAGPCDSYVFANKNGDQWQSTRFSGYI